MSTLDLGQVGTLGAHWDGSGVNVSVWSKHAQRIELCVFDPTGRRELARHELPGRSGDVFHGRLPGAGPGLVYGLRAHGPYEPHRGHRFNPNKLLIDPHARELVGRFRWDPAVLGYEAGHPDGCASFDSRDSAAFVPKCRVAGPIRPIADRLPKPGTAWSDTVLHELHVRGFTARHPRIPGPLRGTIEGLAHPQSIAHLKRIGVTAVELLPVAAWIDELHLVQRGLVNYWGYNPIAFFAMQPLLAGPRGIAAMVDAVERLHAAGIEVILDVVFNHTGEGDERGPTLSLRGLDNASYYSLDPNHLGGYRNLSGCGNTLAAHHPQVSALIVDALRFWAVEVGVDGFRFDLASAIARDAHGHFSTGLPWMHAARTDPMLARCKWIAESWDVEGHFVGRFGHGWSEWNDRYRDDQRRFWRGDAGMIGALATRLAGSSDLFKHDGRTPGAGINFLTAHDGMTLADLTSYRHRRNEANGENNRDGTSNDHSDDCGAEGPTDDPLIRLRRTRRMRAMLASLLLSRGVPMLRAGDEFAATQQGNNNAYCQDGPLTWLDWPRGGRGDPSDLVALLATLTRLRRQLPALRVDRFFEGRPLEGSAVPDITWLRPDGVPMTPSDWHDPQVRSIAALLDAGAPRPGEPHDLLWLSFAAGEGPVSFQLPAEALAGGHRPWLRVLDTSADLPNLNLETHGRIMLQAPAVALCVGGEVARVERRRWQPGMADAVIVAAQREDNRVEVVLDTHLSSASQPAALVLTDFDAAPGDSASDQATLRRWDFTPGIDTEVLESVLLEGHRLERHAVNLPMSLPAGRGTMLVDAAAPGAMLAPKSTRAGGAATVLGRPAPLYSAPHRCWLPAELRRRDGAWILSVQLYSLSSAGSWGIGDFDDLARLAERAGAIGAAGVLVSPVHAPSLAWPDRGSPYSPSSRLALNPLFICLPRAADALERALPVPRFTAWLAQGGTQERLASVRASTLIDYPQVVALKREAFERLWRDFQSAPTGLLHTRFEAWRKEAAHRLRPMWLFEALCDRLGGTDWRHWPGHHAHPDAPATLAFEQKEADTVGLQAFIQWLAALQWQDAGERAQRAGARIGPIADLAVGADAGGADAWAMQTLLADGFELGAPPDPFCPEGQAWGLPPWRPDALTRQGFSPFSGLLDATMAGAGGLRIDHVMALERLFWVPRGQSASAGRYVAYPLEALLQVVAAHSARHRCLVIGEDLGTVRPGLRERLASAGVLSYKVAWFERAHDGSLVDPASLPPLAAACASTHDLPTIDGWAAGRDIDERQALGLLDDEAARHERAARRHDLQGILHGLDRHGLHGRDLTERLHRWLAASSARLAIVQLEDVTGLHRQPNLPGTPDQAPNWRQKLPVAIEALDHLTRWQDLRMIFARRSGIGAPRQGRPEGG